MNDDKNYSNEPLSISEIRSNKENNASLAKPRDVLIETLRMLDKGEINPTALTIVWREEDQEGSKIYYHASGPSLLTTIGMLEYAKLQMFEAV